MPSKNWPADVAGPDGAVSIVAAEQAAEALEGAATTASSDIDSHTRTSLIRLHHAALLPDDTLVRPDEVFRIGDEPGHDELRARAVLSAESHRGKS